MTRIHRTLNHFVSACCDPELAGAGNLFSTAGHYTLLKHLHDNFGATWEEHYAALVRFLDQHMLSLGCELVTQCLGVLHKSHIARALAPALTE